MKVYSKYILGLAACSLLAMSSCTDLNENVYDSLTDANMDFTNSDVQTAVKGEAIAQFRYIYWTWDGYHDLQEECADLYMTPLRLPEGWGAQYILLHKHTWTNETSHLGSVWNAAYTAMGYMNQAIDVLPEGKDRDQVRFLRATTYWMLMDSYRNVPLDTTQVHEDGYLPVQMTAKEVFDYCEKELLAIKESLGTEHTFGYPNKYAAEMTLAKMYLNYNTYFDGSDNTYYEKALEMVNDVIANGGYSLSEDYADNFKADISKSPEVIFAIPLDSKRASHNYMINKCLVGTGGQAYGYSGSPWNGSCAVPQFIDTYDEDDKRLEDTWTGGIQRAAVKNSDGTYTPQAGDPIAFDTDDWSGTGYLNYSQRVHSIDNPGAYTQEGYRYIKNEIVAGDKGTYGDDVAFYRLADAMFIKAECLLRLGRDKQTAADLVTQVRKRAFDDASKATRTVAQLEGGSVYKYGHDEYTSKGYNDWSQHVTTNEGGDDIELGGLLDDLAWEFVGEHHRRQDLIRFKMKDGRSVFTGKSWFCKDATTDKTREVFAIPKLATDANISLKQNEGYN